MFVGEFEMNEEIKECLLFKIEVEICLNHERDSKYLVVIC